MEVTIDTESHLRQAGDRSQDLTFTIPPVPGLKFLDNCTVALYQNAFLSGQYDRHTCPVSAGVFLWNNGRSLKLMNFEYIVF